MTTTFVLWFLNDEAMKKSIILTIALLLLAGTVLRAVPAYPGVIKYRQPDGTYINIQIHGDEFYHYTTSNGRVVAMDKDGFYRPAMMPVRNEQSVRSRRAMVGNIGKTAEKKKSLTQGSNRFIVMLIEFSDLEFSVPNAHQAFSNMLNQKGYSDNGGTGSVYDYYYENSRGQFNPTYDVIGPIKVPGAFADYGGNDNNGSDKNPRGALLDACQIASSEGLCDFSNYDNDNDGVVDNIFFFYAGHNEAEGGGEDTIWPHAWSVSGTRLNGVYLGSYACTSEYSGSKGNTMAGIGTFCHEFGHVLGLPDFYDTDYEKNGTAKAVYAFSLMCNGSYNNNGRTPPYLGAMERWILGWKEDLPEWDSAGAKTIKSVQENDGYITPTSMDMEFFLYEVRDGTGWDKYITTNLSSVPPQGMLVYHVDLSTNIVSGKEARALWNSNQLNCYEVHPCYYVVGASLGYAGYNDLLYPGTTGTTSFEGTDWAGYATGYKLSDINYQDGTVSLNLSLPTSKSIVGTVTDSKGNPLTGVKVSVADPNASNVKALLKGQRLISQFDLEKVSGYTTLTGIDGKYEVEIPFEGGPDFQVTYSLEMYYSKTEKVSAPNLRNKNDVVLFDLGEGVQGELCKHEEQSGYTLGFKGDGPWSGTFAVMFTPEELASHVGQSLTAINYIIKTDSFPEKLDVFVDFDNQRVFTRTINTFSSGIFNKVDISDAGIVIPSDKKVYIGYSIKNINYQHFITFDVLQSNGYEGGGMVLMNYTTEGSDSWQSSGYNFMIDADVVLNVSPFDDLGAKVISNPGNGTYALGSEFSLAFINPSAGEKAESVAWYYDGAPVSGASVTLSAAGKHKVKAIVSYSDGSTEEIVQEIEVK